MCHFACAVALLACLTMSVVADGETRRDVFVRFGAPPGGDGSREQPYSSLQDCVDRHDADWGQVFLMPGVYEEDVDVHRGRFWFFPAQQYGVELRGSIAIRRPGTKLRGLDIRSDGNGIILAEGATDVEVQHCRIFAVGDDCAAILVDAPGGLSGLIGGNVVDLRDSEGTARVGIRVRVHEGTTGLRLDHNRIAGCDTGVVFERGEDVTEERNMVSGCELLDNAVGLRIAAPGVRADWSQFRNNSAAGVEVLAGPTTVRGCRFEANGAGIFTRAADVRLESNVLLGSAPAVRVLGGQASLVHNTVHAVGGQEPLIAIAEGASAALSFNILSGPGELLEVSGTATATRNLFSHQTPGAGADPDPIFGAPGFVGVASGDLHLADDSPARGSATGSEALADADGIGRPRGEQPCVGAYEAPGKREGAEYFVRPGAQDGDGSHERPFGTVASALEGALPADTITLAPGDYSESVTIERSGAPGAPLLIRSAQPRAAVFRDSTWTLNECSHVRIEGLSFVDCARGFALGPYVRDCELVGNSIVREPKGGGAISVYGPGASGNLFEGNVIALNHGGVGLQINCQRFNWRQTLRGNDISGCYYGVQSGGGSYPTAPPGYHVVEDNDLHHNWKDGYHSKTTDNILRGNDIHHNASSGITTRYGARNVIFGNRVHDNGSHGMRLHSPSHFVANNLVYANGRAGIYLSSWPGGMDGEFPHNFEPFYEPPHEVWIAHNSVYGNARSPISGDSGSRFMLLRNILVGSGDDQVAAVLLGPSAAIRQAEGNIYWGCRPPLLREYEGGVYERVADPGFLDPGAGDFRLAPDSPARQLPDFADALSSFVGLCGGRVPAHAGSDLGPPED